MVSKRNYNIVLYTNDRESSSLLIDVLTRHFNSVLVVATISDIEQQLKEKTPKVLLIDATSFQKSLMAYYEALNSTQIDETCEHFIVSIISRHDEDEAYEAHNSGIIDDYVVTNPLYEKHRPIVICSHLLNKLGITQEKNTGLEFIYKKESYFQDVRNVVARGLEQKEKLRLSFEESIIEVEQALDNATVQLQQQSDVILNLDVIKSTLASIRSDEIRPRLVKLQNKAINLLQEFVIEVNEITQDEKKSENTDRFPPVKDKEDSAPVNAIQNMNNEDAAIEADKVKSKLERRTPKILLVEDDPISAHLTNTILHKYDTKVEVVSTGRRALVCLESVRYDLILMDINLPDTNGLYLVNQAIRNKSKNSTTPFIMLTGNKNRHTVKKAKDCGAKGYLIKPLSRQSLLKLFKSYDITLIATQ